MACTIVLFVINHFPYLVQNSIDLFDYEYDANQKQFRK